MGLDRTIRIKHTLEEDTVIGGQMMNPNTWYDIIDNPGRLAIVNHNKAIEYIFAGTVQISNGVTVLDPTSGYQWLTLNKKKDLDGRDLTHSTARYLGTYTYFTGIDDDHNDPHAVGGDNVCELIYDHTVGSPLTKTMYMDFNTIKNETYVRQGDIQWLNAHHDSVSFTIVPKTTPYTVSSNTSFDLYGGYLITPNPFGTGTIQVETSQMVPVQNVPNEFGILPGGYWDATWNSTTKQFENIVPNYTGEGDYNMFGYEIEMYRFMHKRYMLGSNRKDCITEDSSRIGHNMRMRIDLETRAPDHDWSWCGNIMLYREKTV